MISPFSLVRTLRHRSRRLQRRFGLNRIDKGDLLRGFRDIGLVPGEEVMFHSSLSAIGLVDGGADAVIDSLLEVVSPGGTVLAPSFSRFDIRKGEFGSWWNPASTSVYTGAISEHFWRRPGASRSDHPTHAVAALGPHAALFCGDHGLVGDRYGFWGTGAFSSTSPWERMIQRDVHYMFIGCTFDVCTLTHHVECYLATMELQGLPPDEERGFANCLRHNYYGGQGVWPDLHRLRMGEAMDQLKLVRHGRVGRAKCMSIRAGTFFREAVRLCQEEPSRWFAPAYLAWSVHVQQRKSEIADADAKRGTQSASFLHVDNRLPCSNPLEGGAR